MKRIKTIALILALIISISAFAACDDYAEITELLKDLMESSVEELTQSSTETDNMGSSFDDTFPTFPFKQDIQITLPEYGDETAVIPTEDVSSDYSVLYNVTEGKIQASKKAAVQMYPASLTKIMTLIVVFENLPNEDSLNDVLEIRTPRGEHSGYGFEMGEKLTVKDLIYAAILQSDGVACITLAEYIAGSEDNFVKLMNEKVKELGLLEDDYDNAPSTNFANCTGLHERYHYTTAYDMAVITAYAMENTYCAEVLTSLAYRPSENFRPNDGCIFWNAFLHNRLSDGNIQPSNATIKGGKTGWAGDESGYCIASFAMGNDGKDYVVITANADRWSAAVDDTLNIYNGYIK